MTIAGRLVDAWVDCSACGNRFGAWIATCPKCGVRNSSFKKRGRTAGWGRGKKVVVYSLVTIGSVFAALMIIGSVALSMQPPAGSTPAEVAGKLKIEPTTTEERDALRQMNLAIIETFDVCVNDGFLRYSQMDQSYCYESMNLVDGMCDQYVLVSCDESKQAQFKTLAAQVGYTYNYDAD